MSSRVQKGSSGVSGGPLLVGAGEPWGLPALKASTPGQVLPAAAPDCEVRGKLTSSVSLLFSYKWG